MVGGGGEENEFGKAAWIVRAELRKGEGEVLEVAEDLMVGREVAANGVVESEGLVGSVDETLKEAGEGGHFQLVRDLKQLVIRLYV